MSALIKGSDRDLGEVLRTYAKKMAKKYEGTSMEFSILLSCLDIVFCVDVKESMLEAIERFDRREAP